MANRTENIGFLHIPKTGGTTLRDIFYSQYSYLNEDEVYTVRTLHETQKFWDLSEEAAEKIKLLIGHFKFGAHYKFSKTFKYVAFIRDPIERSLSSYYFSKWDVNNEQYEYINKSHISPVDFLCGGRFPWLENTQTKLIAGIDDASQPCDEEIYRRAISNIENHFHMVGTIEKYDESLICLMDQLNWDYPLYTIKNTTPKHIKNDQLSEGDLDAIREINKFDQKLYDLIDEKLKNIISTNSEFTHQLDAFRLKNAS